MKKILFVKLSLLILVIISVTACAPPKPITIKEITVHTERTTYPNGETKITVTTDEKTTVAPPQSYYNNKDYSQGNYRSNNNYRPHYRGNGRVIRWHPFGRGREHHRHHH